MADLSKFLRGEEDLLGNKRFLEILKIYPQSIQKDIKLYLILNEIDYIIKTGKIVEFSKNRIKNILKKSLFKTLSPRQNF